MAKGQNVLTTGDVARICNVAPRLVVQWFDSGKLKGYRIPDSKDRRIPVESLTEFMKQNNMPTAAIQEYLGKESKSPKQLCDEVIKELAELRARL